MTREPKSKEPKEETERVVMLWPASLKATVRMAAGPRGLTDYVIAAVEEYLKHHPPVRPRQPMPQTRIGGREIENVPLPPEPELLTPTPDGEETCPRCGEPLVAGECWTCVN